MRCPLLRLEPLLRLVLQEQLLRRSSLRREHHRKRHRVQQWELLLRIRHTLKQELLRIRRNLKQELLRIRHRQVQELLRIRHRQVQRHSKVQVQVRSKVLVPVRSKLARERNSYDVHESLHTSERTAWDGCFRHKSVLVRSKASVRVHRQVLVQARSKLAQEHSSWKRDELSVLRTVRHHMLFERAVSRTVHHRSCQRKPTIHSWREPHPVTVRTRRSR